MKTKFLSRVARHPGTFCRDILLKRLESPTLAHWDTLKTPHAN